MKSNKSSSYFLKLIHVDIWGTPNLTFLFGSHYSISPVDDFTHYTWIYFLKCKSEFFQVFQSFHNFVTKH